MRKTILAVLLLGAAAPVCAADLNVDPYQFDISPLFSKLGAATIVTHKGDLLAGGSYQFAEWDKYALSAHAGVVWDANAKNGNKGVGGFFVSSAVDADRAIAWSLKRLDLQKRGIKLNFTIPKLKVKPGIMGGHILNFGWVWGGFVNASVSFGGKE